MPWCRPHEPPGDLPHGPVLVVRREKRDRQEERALRGGPARDEVDRAKAQLKQTQTIANESEIRAPADAIVLHRMAEPGLLLASGQPGLTLAFANRFIM